MIRPSTRHRRIVAIAGDPLQQHLTRDPASPASPGRSDAGRLGCRPRSPAASEPCGTRSLAWSGAQRVRPQSSSPAGSSAPASRYPTGPPRAGLLRDRARRRHDVDVPITKPPWGEPAVSSAAWRTSGPASPRSSRTSAMSIVGAAGRTGPGQSRSRARESRAVARIAGSRSARRPTVQHFVVGHTCDSDDAAPGRRTAASGSRASGELPSVEPRFGRRRPRSRVKLRVVVPAAPAHLVAVTTGPDPRVGNGSRSMTPRRRAAAGRTTGSCPPTRGSSSPRCTARPRATAHRHVRRPS